MAVSVVTVTYNSADAIVTCWQAIRRHLPGAEIVVVDNASGDGTAQLCAELEGVRCVANDENIGFGRACNQGVAAATGSHVLLLNPDVVVTHVDHAWLRDECAEVPFGLAAPVLNGHAWAGSTTRHWGFDLLSHVAGPLRPKELPSLPRVIIRRSAWWPPGAILLFSRTEFARVGGFDPRFFLFYEDQDLARRYRAAGLPLRVTKALSAVHHSGSSSAIEGGGTALRHAWAYLSWLEYLAEWNGHDTAVRAATMARALRARVDQGLALVERGGPIAARAGRKRAQFAEFDRLVVWQSSMAPGTASADFCPEARKIVSML